MSTSQEQKTENIGARLREALKDQNKRQVARKIGCDYTTLYCWFRGETAPGARLLAALATECSVSVDWILGLTDDPRPNWTQP